MLLSEGERIKELRQALKLTQTEFGLFFNVGKSFISSIENNRAKLSHDNLVLLLVNYNVNLNWLLAGKGEMFNSDEKNNIDEKIENKLNELLKEHGLK